MGETGLLVKAGWTVAAILAVPVVAALLLAWTLLGYLCSLGGCSVFFFVTLLLVTAAVVDMGQGQSAFDSSMLDAALALLAMYLCYLILLRHHDSNAALARSRRLAALPVASAITAYLSAKLAAVSGNETQDRRGWKLAWLWVALVSSAFVYVSMARWWVDTSMPRLQEAEAALMEAYSEVEIEQSVVSGLGTICVKGFHEPLADRVSSDGRASEKPMLVLVRGYAAGNGCWMFVLKILSAHFRVACVEMYGCGRSDRRKFTAKGPAETEKILVESLEKWRAEMGIEEMVLCGHSLGGMMVAAYAMAHPKRLRKLFLLSPAGVGGIPLDGETGEGSSLLYKVYSLFWTSGLGFLFLIRWAGPLGARVAKYIIARRLSWVPATAKIKDVDGDLLGEYVYQLLGLPASGEKIIFPLLDPMLHAYRPVLETLKGGAGGTAPSSRANSTDGGCGRILEGSEGAQSNEDEERGGGREGRKGISCPVSIIYGSPDHDWMPYRHGVALAENLTRQGITANVYSVPEAGHTLIIDNPEGFTRVFLEAYSNAGL